MRRKIILIILIALSLAVAMWYSWGLFPVGHHPGNDKFTAAGVDFIAALGVVTWMGWKKNGWAAAGRS